jgi:Ca2+-binding RTX toxin-like protein
MSTLIAWNSMGSGIDMSGITTGGGFLFNENSISTTYLGEIDWDTIAFSVSGAGLVKYFVVSGTVDLSSGDAVLTELIYGDVNANPLISWTDTDLHINLFDDFSSGINYSLLNTSDNIWGNKFADIIKAGDGNDDVQGNGGNDIIYGERDNDSLSGGDGNDSLYGGEGNDSLFGYKDDDILYGGTGNDLLGGGDGNDSILGGTGKDVLTGGSGRDYFDFNKITETGITLSTRDVIKDFSKSQGDKIDLRTIDAKTGGASNDAFSFVSKAPASDGTASSGRLWYANGILYGSNDSDKAAEFSIEVVLTGISTSNATDYIFM